MKKLMMMLCSVCLLIVVSGCQTANESSSANKFVEEFITEFLSFTYEEGGEYADSYAKVEEKIESYFTEDAYLYFSKQNAGDLPIRAAEKYQSDIIVSDIQLEELFNEETEVSYNVSVEVQLPSEVANVSLKLSIRTEDNTWKIYAIQFLNVDKSLT